MPKYTLKELHNEDNEVEIYRNGKLICTCYSVEEAQSAIESQIACDEEEFGDIVRNEGPFYPSSEEAKWDSVNWQD